LTSSNKNVITSYPVRSYKPRSPLYHYIQNLKKKKVCIWSRD